jgi:hypothetical protein
MNLTMQGNNIDDYIATFDHLVKCTGWNTSDQGVLEKFKWGLKRSIAVRILNKEMPPNTLASWKEVARKEILCAAQIDADLGPNPNLHPGQGPSCPSQQQQSNNLHQGNQGN